VARARARNLIDAIGFVREYYGAAGIGRVEAAVDAELRALLEGVLRADDWYPLAALVSYLAVAHRELAPFDDDFYHRQGFYTGQQQRAHYLGMMVATPELRAKMAPTVWRMFYDVGHLVVAGQGREACGQIHDFPTTPALCQRFLGIWEGIASEPGVVVKASEGRCVLRGDPYCEFNVRYEQ